MRLNALLLSYVLLFNVECLEAKFKTFHFQEINWFISFPIRGNCGKYPEYIVLLFDGKVDSFNCGKRVKLEEILEMSEVDANYSHTVGYFKNDGAMNFKPEYLEIREIKSIEDFWAFLNAVNL